MPVVVSKLICFRWLISRRWQFREKIFQRFGCTFLPWLKQQYQRKHELYEKMHTIIVFASFFSYKNFIYTWNHSFISFLPFFSCFSSNNSSNPHHILIKTFFRRVSLLHDSFDSFFLVSIQTERKYRIEKKNISKYNFIHLFVFHLALIVFRKIEAFCSSGRIDDKKIRTGKNAKHKLFLSWRFAANIDNNIW